MPVDSKLFKIDAETKDISAKAKRRLGDYLSSRTLKQDISGEFSPGDYTHSPPRPNTYSVEPSSQIFSSLENELADASRNGQSVFVKENSEEMARHRESFLVDDDNKIFRDFLRNDVDDKQRDAVLKGVNEETNPASQELKRQVSGVLKKNRFTLNSTFSDSAQFVPIGETKSGESLSTSEDTNMYDEMRKHGIRNLLLSTGTPLKNLENPDEIKSLQSIAPNPQALLNGLIRKSMDEFRREGKNDIPEENIPSAGLFGTRKSLNDSTQGQLNNYLQPFGGAFPVSTTLNAAILLVTMTAASIAVASLFSVTVKEDERVDYTGGEFASLGKSSRIQDERQFFADKLGLIIPKTKISSTNSNNNIAFESVIVDLLSGETGLAYLDMTVKGLAMFIGVGASNISSQQTLSGLSNLTGGAGYYAIVARNLIRSLDTYGNIVASAFDTNQGLVSGVQGTATILSELKRNKLLRFVDTMARIGVATSQFLDNETFESTQPVDKDSNPDVEQARRVSRVEQARRVSSGRRYKGSRELSHSFRAIDDIVPKLITATTLNMDNRLGKLNSKDVLISSGSKVEDRITQELANKIEDELDAEYVPFYFKDLRTNEILAFHAFISSLSDSYTANYNDTSAYGRLDPVKTYKDTTRSISFEFMIVSTSPKDFDRMWYSINRLTNMVYPQWSKGEQLDSNDGIFPFVFTQPFSQVISSSPLIRVRIGDLIRSNYSRFNLSRIFGLGEEENFEGDDVAGFVDPGLRSIREEFKSPESSNRIIRAFEDSSGKGLAGFITNLSYEWYSDAIQWETKADSRAPTSCKVTVSFSPIHDIPMGLDHQGAMRAAPYPVGKIVNDVFGMKKGK